MIFEFIATVAAAFGLAGVALLIRHLTKLSFKKNTPKWLTPVFAAIGIFAFQIHQEYNWYSQAVNKLPENVSVVKTVESTSWYKPWSYIKPQTLRFMAVDKGQAAPNNLHLVNLYLFERRMRAQHVPQVIDCGLFRRADYYHKKVGLHNLNWMQLPKNDPLIKTVCG